MQKTGISNFFLCASPESQHTLKDLRILSFLSFKALLQEKSSTVVESDRLVFQLSS
jgi:hypothetical protein